MSEFGGTDSSSLKDGIDSIFTGDGHLLCTMYRDKVVSCTSDGASVNTGAKQGLMVKMSRDSDRPWLLPIHCVNHRVELAAKDAFTDSIFQDIQKLYLNIFYLCRNSGAIKSDIKAAAKALNISFYSLPKLSGTRFIPHHRRAISRLLDMWPAIISALDNTLAIRKHKPETKGKILGIIKQLRSYKSICLACCYLDVLEKIAPVSKVFEHNELLPFEVKGNVQNTCLQLEDIIESVESNEDWDSHLARFVMSEEEGVPQLTSSSYIKHGDMLKKPANRDHITITFENVTNFDESSVKRATQEKARMAEKLLETFKSRFESFNDEIFTAMRWMDPRGWEDDKNYAHEMLDLLSKRFEIPLNAAGFDRSKLFSEWKAFRIYVKSTYSHSEIASGKTNPRKIWKDSMQYKKKSFPNMCIMVELIFCISGSNSAVERAFSLLTLLLTDRRMKLKHETMFLYMNIKCNDHLWDDIERKSILNEAVDIHLQMRRKKVLDKVAEGEPAKKQARVEESEEEVSDTDQDCFSSDDEFEEVDSDEYM